MELIEGGYKNAQKRQERTNEMKKMAYFRMLQQERNKNAKMNRNPSAREVFLGIRLFLMDGEKEAIDKKDLQEAIQLYNIGQMILSFARNLSPKEIIQQFPITKMYEKKTPRNPYGEFKDYIFVMENICKKYPMNKPLGKNAMNFFMDYLNRDIDTFVVRNLLLLNHIQRLKGERTFIEEFAEENNISTFKKQKDAAGKEFFISDDGKVIRAKKKKPRHLHLTKKG